jgi:rhodanese-related sulfurtransferase
MDHDVPMIKELSPRALEALLRAPPPGFQLVDVRLPWEHEIARIPGSTLVPMHEIPARLAELRADGPVVVYCHHGIRSRHVASFLLRSGFPDVSNLDGGIARWADEVDPAMEQY